MRDPTCVGVNMSTSEQLAPGASVCAGIEQLLLPVLIEKSEAPEVIAMLVTRSGPPPLFKTV